MGEKYKQKVLDLLRDHPDAIKRGAWAHVVDRVLKER